MASNPEPTGDMYRMCLAKTKYVLVDLSGTLHVESVATPYAVEALCRLREAGINVRFVTNTTKESKRQLGIRLNQLGFDIQEEEIFTSLIAARKKIAELGIRPLFLVEDEALEDFEGIETNDPNAVVVGLSPTHFNYEKLNEAFRLIKAGGPLIAIHKGKYFQTRNGLSLGPGPFVRALEFATGREAIVVGKPNPEFFKLAIDESSVSPSDVVMIGDDVEDDVIGAIEAGYKGILVKTGKYRTGDELKFQPKVPTLVAETFAEAVKVLIASTEAERLRS